MRTTPKMKHTLERIEEHLLCICHCMIAYNTHHGIKPVFTFEKDDELS